MDKQVRKNVIKVEGGTKVYNPDTIPVHALRGVDLEVKEGEFTTLVGASGSGKTTLLNIIGGLDDATSGKVWVDDQDISELTDAQMIEFRKQNIGFVFQAYNLIPVLTAKENVAFVMLLQGKSQQERDSRVKELLTAVGLSEHLDRRPAELSGGQQQRVAVARALASKPKFVLADEPTANLDSKSTANLLDIMAELNRKEDMTFVFSTHDQRVIKRARRVVTLEDGAVISDVYQNQEKEAE